jgi:hypothetical protein
LRSRSKSSGGGGGRIDTADMGTLLRETPDVRCAG